MVRASRPFPEVPGAAPASAAGDVVPFSFDGAAVRVITRDAISEQNCERLARGFSRLKRRLGF